FDPRAEFHTFGFHLPHAPVDQALFHFEIRNAVTQQATDAIVLLEQSDAVTSARQLLRTGKTRGARSDHRHPLAGLYRREIGVDPALFPAPVHDLAFNRLDRDRVVLDVQGTRRLAWRGTNAAGEF